MGDALGLPERNRHPTGHPARSSHETLWPEADEHLLEEVFRLTCRYAGQAPGQALYVEEIRRTTNANIGWQRILTYLKFLDGTLLMRLIEPLELRLKKRRGASKLCLFDHVLRAAWLQKVVPLSLPELDTNPHLADLAGHIAERARIYLTHHVVVGYAEFSQPNRPAAARDQRRPHDYG